MATFKVEDTRNIKGLKDLAVKLAKLETTVAGKQLRNSVSNAVTPIVRKMRLAVPVGTQMHRTYKDNPVSPGFLKRSIRKRSFFNKRTGMARVFIGVKPEAFYGINFLDLGPHTVSQRDGAPIQPYIIRGQSWFKQTFINGRREMENGLRRQLKAKIDKLTK